MGIETPIQWCDSTVNPVMGCNGCELWNEKQQSCYAGNLSDRRTSNSGYAPNFLTPTLFYGRTAEAARWSDLTGQERAIKPWLNGAPRLIFTEDMGDALSERNVLDSDLTPIEGGVPFEFLKEQIVDVVLSRDGYRHRWLWLTKRPGRMARFSRWLRKETGIAWPLNLWAGTSITSSSTLWRLDRLQQVGNSSTTRFLSVEPLWEQVSFKSRLEGIAWLIVGGESKQGSAAQPFHCEWAERIHAECATANVPFFLKQLGKNAWRNGKQMVLRDPHGGDWDQWPESLRIREIPNCDLNART